MPSNNSLEYIQNLEAAAQDINGNIEDLNLFTVKIRRLDHLAENEKIFRLLYNLRILPTIIPILL